MIVMGMLEYVKYASLILSFVIMQVSSNTAEGIISKSFDIGFSIGLLVIAVVVLAVDYYKYRKQSNATIKSMAKENKERGEKFEELIIKQVGLSEQQIATNKELTKSIEHLSEAIEKII